MNSRARQINDDLPPAGRDRRDSGGHVKLPAQRDDDLTVDFAGTHVRVRHRGAFLLQQQGGVLTQRLFTSCRR
jgi:hypothetical protein